MTTAIEEARRYADSVIALIPELIDQSVERRREQACWHELVAQHRLGTCRPIMRPWWRWAKRRHEARCRANKAMSQQCAIAAVRYARIQNGAGAA